MKIKFSRNGEITLLFTDIGKSCSSCVFNVVNMYFNAIRENKILAKISVCTVFTVCYLTSIAYLVLFVTLLSLLIIRKDFLTNVSLGSIQPQAMCSLIRYVDGRSMGS